MFEAIISNVLAQQQVFMHRDFHSRNLMFMDQGIPGVLDFQDAVEGPAIPPVRLHRIGGDELRLQGWRIRVLSMRGRAPGQFLLKPLPPEPAAPDA